MSIKKIVFFIAVFVILAVIVPRLSIFLGFIQMAAIGVRGYWWAILLAFLFYSLWQTSVKKSKGLKTEYPADKNQLRDVTPNTEKKSE